MGGVHMRVGYSGRPPSPPSRGGRWSPADRVRRYAAVVAEAGLDCVEIPANLLLGKGDWRNQLLTECTDARSPRTDSADVEVLMRLGDQHLAEPANVVYARQLAALYGASMVTLAYRPSRGPKLDTLSRAADSGVPLALAADWSRGRPRGIHGDGAQCSGWTCFTASAPFMGSPGATVRRALASCMNSTGQNRMHVQTAGGRFRYRSAQNYTMGRPHHSRVGVPP